VLVLGLGVAMYVVTRPPNRGLDAQGKAWVDAYERWIDARERQITRAQIGLGFSSETRNDRLLEPLRTCSATFARLGLPPGLLSSVHEAVTEACGEAERAVRLNDRFAFAALASTKEHLGEAEDRLQLSRWSLAVQLEE
jgi:hypothetical protein